MRRAGPGFQGQAALWTVSKPGFRAVQIEAGCSPRPEGPQEIPAQAIAQGRRQDWLVIAKEA